MPYQSDITAVVPRCPICDKEMHAVSYLGTKPIYNHDNPCLPKVNKGFYYTDSLKMLVKAEAT